MSLKWLQSYDITRSADSDVGDSDVEKKKATNFRPWNYRLSGAHQEIQSNNIQLRIRTISNTLTVLCFFFPNPFSLSFFFLSLFCFLFLRLTPTSLARPDGDHGDTQSAVCSLQSAVCSLPPLAPRPNLHRFLSFSVPQLLLLLHPLVLLVLVLNFLFSSASSWSRWTHLTDV